MPEYISQRVHQVCVNIWNDEIKTFFEKLSKIGFAQNLQFQKFITLIDSVDITRLNYNYQLYALFSLDRI